MLIDKFKKIRDKIYRDIHSVTEEDFEFMKDVLRKREMTYERIKTYPSEDSGVLALYTLKHSIMVFLEFIFRSGVEIGRDICDGLCDALFSEIPSLTSPECSLEVEEVKSRTDEIIIDILCSIGTGSHTEKILSYLSSQEAPDKISVNLAAVFGMPTWKSYDLKVVSEPIFGPVLLGLLRSFKSSLRLRPREKIISACKKRLKEKKDKSTVYQIFYEINVGKDMEMFDIQEDEKEEDYVGFISSLMVDAESYLRGYEVISRTSLFAELRKALETIGTLDQTGYKMIMPEDEKLMHYLLEVIDKLVSSESSELGFVRLYFMRFVELLLGTVIGPVPLEIKGLIYSILGSFMRDEDVRDTVSEFIRNVGVFKKDVIYADFEKELETRTFFMAPKFLKFCKFLDGKEPFEFSVHALKSEDSLTVMSCFDVLEGFVSEKAAECGVDCEFVSSQLLLMSQHIRVAMLTDPRVISRVMEYQLDTGTVIRDVYVINAVVSTPSARFFQYARLFDDFSFFMGENFLERLAESEKEGFEYLREVTKGNHEACKFVMNNEGWFNAYTRNSPGTWELVAQVYENLVDYDIENVDVGFYRGFIIPDIAHSSVFRTLGKLTLYTACVKKSSHSNYVTDRDYELDESTIREYCLYMKCRMVAGDDVSGRIKWMMQQHTEIDELLGYYKVVTGSQLEIPSSNNLLAGIGRSDTSLFISLFPTASSIEKFLLFFYISEDMTTEESRRVERIIMDEVTRITVSKTRKLSEKMVLRQCLVTLLLLDNIDSIVRLVNDYEDVDLLLKVNIRNILSGGTHFNSSLIMRGSLELQVCAVFLLYYKSVWDVGVFGEWISHLQKECKGNENLDYMIDDLKRMGVTGVELS